jgi:hypothetical protein
MKATESIPTRKGATPTRSPGELAFDRCFYPFGAILAVVLVGIFGDLFISRRVTRKPHSEAELAAAMPDPAWHVWLPFTLGVLLCIYWLWALWGLLRAWKDPRARVLRFSALFLLFFDAGIAIVLLSSPFSSD